ncbi:MAG: nuclear transport factor 2 family protein [Trueperaceae bacterium]
MTQTLENTQAHPGDIQDRYNILDALHRFARGIDFNDMNLFASAFTEDAIADFTPAAKKVGIEFPLLQGKETIVGGIAGSVALLDTTHVVSNPRISVSGNKAKLYAIVEAQHLPPANHSRHFLMKNQYEVDLVKHNDLWLITHMLIYNTWTTGDSKVIVGQ